MNEPITNDIGAALAAHDAALAAQGLTVWIGGEPTFTDRCSEAAEWHAAAVGADKEARARRLAARLAVELPGGLLLRSLGRLYPGERERRFSYGLLARRDGLPLWQGPPDPLCGGAPADAAAVQGLAEAITAALPGSGLQGLAVPGAPEHRVALRLDAAAPGIAPDDPRLTGASLHEGEGTPARQPANEPWIFIVSLVREGEADYAALELPSIDADGFLTLLALVGRGARAAGLGGLILHGAPPPADPRLAFSTVTPDPGVIELNQAPADCIGTLYAENRRLFAAAAREGLSPLRLHYNGQVDDSGGGGQLSIGGPVPGASPFRVEPQLAPRLVRYLNHHPSLSFWFAPQYLGSCSQAPRPDEGVADLFAELGLALDQLAARPDADTAFVWRCLSPFLRDVSGNSHRSELNIEKLWSPVPRPDGIDGVVEFRAFRMARTPESLAALGALVRSLVAMLMVRPFAEPLIEWGPQLHDRFALPFFLAQDLDRVLADLAGGGFGLDPILAALLQDDSARTIASVDCGGGTVLEVTAALEFWPQVGDGLSQPADSRLVDASTARLQLCLSGGEAADLAQWRLAVGGWAVPLRLEEGLAGPAALTGVRYRRFAPGPLGLHPGIAPTLPVPIQLHHPDGRLIEADYHEWRPEGGPYPGLPQDLDDAARRRADRLLVRRGNSDAPPPVREPHPAALSAYCFDLRRV